MTDKHNVLTFRAVPENKCGTINFSQFEDTLDSGNNNHHHYNNYYSKLVEMVICL